MKLRYIFIVLMVLFINFFIEVEATNSHKFVLEIPLALISIFCFKQAYNGYELYKSGLLLMEVDNEVDGKYKIHKLSNEKKIQGIIKTSIFGILTILSVYLLKRIHCLNKK